MERDRLLGALAGALIAALALAGCGGTRTVTRTVPAPRLAPAQIECTPANEAMQCLLPPAARRFTAPFGVHVYAFGVDFAWGAPAASTLRRLGKRFGASYLSFDPSKGWAQRPGLVSAYHAAGLGTVDVWETTASRAAQGCSAGAADAREAARQARAIGNTSRPITFAIDFEASGQQVAPYFRCAHGYLRDRANAYGAYAPLAYLCAHHLVGRWNWQTYAWSGGRWLSASCAPLEQYLNDGSVDYDRAIAADYGQFPYAAGPSPAQRRAAKRRSLALHETERRVLHALIGRHHCRPGQHVTPRSPVSRRRRYHNVLCPRWLKRGASVTATSVRLRHELHLGPLPVLR